MLTIILMIISFAVLLVILAVDLIFQRYKKPIYLANQSHVNLYIVPFLLSFVLFTLAISGKDMTVLGIFMLLIFTAVYIYMLSFDKIILLGADMDNVLDELEYFLKESNRNFRIHRANERIATVEINNYRNAFTVRDADRWIEIENHIHYDEAFIKDLHAYFKKRASMLKALQPKPNIFFYILIVFIISLGILFTNFYL